MAYKYISAPSPNFTPANRGKGDIKAIVIHWWGDPNTNPTFENVVSYLRQPSSQVSAHFVATGTNRRVAHLVEEKNWAWHARQANPTTIGIECDPRCRDSDYDVVAELVINLRKKYGNLPLQRHSKYVATQCPGNYNLAKLERVIKSKQGGSVATKLTDAITTKEYQVNRGANPTAAEKKNWRGKTLDALSFAFKKENDLRRAQSANRAKTIEAQKKTITDLQNQIKQGKVKLVDVQAQLAKANQDISDHEAKDKVQEEAIKQLTEQNEELKSGISGFFSWLIDKLKSL